MVRRPLSAPSETLSWKVLLGALGPGLLMAGAAIGVSHVVQATRAGADYGWQLLGLVLLVHLMKYPFFEYGHRYASATGESLLHGYLRLGRWVLFLFLGLNLMTAVISIAGVTLVTAILGNYLLRVEWEPTLTSSLLLVLCLGILAAGHYRWLDRSVKAIMAVLFVTTLIAFLIAASDGPVAPPDFAGPSPWSVAGLGFLIALMGWMPAPIELSVWQSLWIGAKEAAQGRRLSAAGIRFDFHVGYGMTLVLAALFLGLGSLVMYGSGVDYAASSAGFATQFIQLYTLKLGAWAGPLVAVAAFTTMLSTTLTVVDAYPRSLAVGWALACRGRREPSTESGIVEVREPAGANKRALHMAWIVASCAVGVIIIHGFRAELVHLLDVATAIAFLTAPVFAWMNFVLVRSCHMPVERQPGGVMRFLSWTGLAFFVGFGLLYLWSRFYF